MLLAGKKVVVVGGSSGIGLSTAEMAKREGADVIVASRNVERLDAAAEKAERDSNLRLMSPTMKVSQSCSALVARSIMSWLPPRNSVRARSRP